MNKLVDILTSKRVKNQFLRLWKQLREPLFVNGENIKRLYVLQVVAEGNQQNSSSSR